MMVAVPILLPLAVGSLCLILGTRRISAQNGLSVFGCAGLLAASVWLLLTVMEEGPVALAVGGWPAPQGIVLVADLFSAIMVVIAALMGLAVAIYAQADIRDERLQRFFFPLYHYLLMGVNGAFLTGDLFNLFVWFEVMLIASFVLLALGGSREQVDGAVKYVVINILSSSFFLIGVGILYAQLGTLNMADVALKLETAPETAPLINSTAILFLVSFGVKAGLFPFFFWLPASYHTPPTAVSAIFAGLLTKVGVYALIRAFTLFFTVDAEFQRNLLIFIAGATMLTGVLGAAAQYDVRRILSFHIISQIGYMIMGLAVFTPLALAGAIFYLVHHIIVKTNLFLVGGVIEKLRGQGHVLRIGGLYKSMPLLAIIFFVAAFSLGGIPPLSGFWAKFAVVKGGLLAEHWVLVAVALGVGALTLFSMTKIWAEAFWKAQPGETDAPETTLSRRDRLALYSPMVLLAVCTVVIGLFGEPLFALSERAADQLLTRFEYIEAVQEAVAEPPQTAAKP